MLRAALRRAAPAGALQRRAQSAQSTAAALRQIRPGTLPSAAVASLRASGVLRPDPHQGTVLPLLDSLHARVTAASLLAAAPAAAAPAPSLWSSVFSAAPAPAPARAPAGASAPGGLYLWGGTGCGKTLLMDVFLACAPAAARAKRVHFHEFMQRVNFLLHRARSGGVRGDPLAAVAQELLAEAWMLCFDEVQVTDVGDAMILRRLFESLYAGGLVMLATSNRAPQQLYAGGLQRDLFLPFVALLTARCAVHHVASPTDHRLRVLAGASSSASASASPGSRQRTPWICPQDGLPASEAAAAAASVARAFEAAWAAAAAAAAGHAPGAPPLPAAEREAALELPVAGAGRSLRAPRALPRARAARFTFEQLCGAPLYAGDYAALTRAFDSVFVEGVPVLGLGERNELRRLVTLVDILYDSKVRLTVSAAASPLATFRTEEGAGAGAGAAAAAAVAAEGGRVSAASATSKAKYDEVFAWDRAVSRLIEMGSEEYEQEVVARERAAARAAEGGRGNSNAAL